MSPKFLNMHQETVIYKVVVFRIKNRLSHAADPCIFSYFFLSSFLHRVINRFDQL